MALLSPLCWTAQGDWEQAWRQRARAADSDPSGEEGDGPGPSTSGGLGPHQARSARARFFRSNDAGTKWYERGLQRLRLPDSGVAAPAYSVNPICIYDGGVEDAAALQWSTLPPSLHFANAWASSTKEKRKEKKQQQVDNLAALLRCLLRPGRSKGVVVVDFCGGSGHTALPLAFRFPECRFVIVDLKKPSLELARQRIVSADLTNVDLVCEDVQTYSEPFHIGLALHACGEATDLVHERCVRARAAYILASCCVGKVQHSRALRYPRSRAFAAALPRDEYLALACAADVPTCDVASLPQQQRRLCKSYVEVDRNMWAQENGYCAHLFLMQPETASPKNDIIAGCPVPEECLLCAAAARLPAGATAHDDDRHAPPPPPPGEHRAVWVS